MNSTTDSTNELTLLKILQSWVADRYGTKIHVIGPLTTKHLGTIWCDTVQKFPMGWITRDAVEFMVLDPFCRFSIISANDPEFFEKFDAFLSAIIEHE